MANALGAYDEVTGFNVLFWMIAFGLICGLMFTCLYSLFTLTDLESDMINPMDACQRLNKMTKYEFFMLVTLGTMLLIAHTWLLALLVWLAAAYSGYKIATSDEGPAGLAKPFEPARLFDDTTIFNDMGPCKNELFVKLAFYLLTFFGVLYHMLRVTIYFILPFTKNALMNTFLRPFSSTKKT